jgi:phosphorylcholine metabolism protein LicD
MYHEVNSIHRIKDNPGVSVPQSLVNYKESKQRNIETVSSVTAIQQGMSPGANVPYKAIAELGARTDVRMKKAAKKLSNLLININKKKIQLIGQYYTEERYYRYEDNKGDVYEGTFRNDELFDVWAREMVEVPQTDEMGNQYTEQVPRNEIFIPEFDIKVTVLSSKPDDRNYYTQLAFDLHNLGLLVGEDLLYTIDEGKLPPTDEILQKVNAQDLVKQMISDLGKLPQEVQQQVMQAQAQALQQMAQNLEQMEQMGKDALQGGIDQMQQQQDQQAKMQTLGQPNPQMARGMY